jgi:hypothetical protein
MRALCSILSVIPLSAAIINLQVGGTTATQAVLRYTAPDVTACTVEVSEEPDYTPLVHDVNPALFAGSHSDGGGRRDRTFVVGKPGTGRAGDNKVYSRALQAWTPHYFRITCGADQATGTFVTSNIPFGRSYNEVPPHDPANPGDYLWPSTEWSNRAQTVVDPHSGTFMRRLSIARDSQDDLNDRTFTTASGTNWTSPSNVLADDASAATYSGASCGASCDWLYVKRTEDLNVSLRIDYFRLDLKGSSSEAGAEDRKLEACITLNGTTCTSNIKEVTLPITESTVYIPSASPTPIDTWRQTGYNHELVTEDVDNDPEFGFLIRKKTSVGSVSLQFARYQLKMSSSLITASGGNFDTCNRGLTTGSDGRQYYLCSLRTSGGGPGALYSFAPSDGTVHFLGMILAGDATSSPTVATGACLYDNVMTGHANPLGFYCNRTDTSGNSVLMRGVFQGDVSQDVVQNSTANFSWKNVTPGSATANYPLGRHIEALVQKFTQDNSSHYSVSYDPTKFSCQLDAAQQDYGLIVCRRVSQDSYGWQPVFDFGNGGVVDVDWAGQGGNTSPIVAAAPVWMRGPTRWCGLHATNVIDQRALFTQTSPGTLASSYYGGGPYRVTIESCISGCSNTDTTATVNVTSTNSGEPVSPVADTTLPGISGAEPGDRFNVVGTSEYVRIVSKTTIDADTKQWAITRGINSSPRTTLTTQQLQAYCTALPDTNPYDSAHTFHWKFLADKFAEDTGGANYFGEGYHNGAHHSMRGAYNYVALYNVIYDPATQEPFNKPYSYGISDMLKVNGKEYPGGGVFQSHPSNLQTASADKGWFTDIRPFIFGTGFGQSSATLQSGTSQVYKWAGADSTQDADGLSRKQIPTLATCGSKVLRDISGPSSSITDADNFTYCVAHRANECRTGAVVGDVYVSCAAAVPSCSSTSSMDICVGDMGPYGLAVNQIRSDYNRDGLRSFVSWGVQQYGIGYARRISGIFARYRLMDSFASAKATPDGSWLIVPVEAHERKDMWAVKLPPFPAKDSVNRSQWVPVPVHLKPPPGLGADNAVVEFGYTPEFQCTSRAEACVKDGNASEPFVFAGDMLTGVPCASGCTVEIPAVSQKVLYYRWKYRDTSNAVVAVSGTRVLAVP